MKVVYITDAIYLQHDTGIGHPESAERLIAIRDAVAALQTVLIHPEPIAVSEALLRSVHTPAHIHPTFPKNLTRHINPHFLKDQLLLF